MRNSYQLIRKIHLYTSLSIVVLLLMYIITSYLMIHHDFFRPDARVEEQVILNLDSFKEIDMIWDQLLDEYHIRGKMTGERITDKGAMTREYVSVRENCRITISADLETASIVTQTKSVAGTLVGFHRLRGFTGPIQYIIYAVLLDLVGLNLILFAVTGMILWMKLLKNNTVAWIVLMLGLGYVGAMIAYLLAV